MVLQVWSLIQLIIFIVLHAAYKMSNKPTSKLFLNDLTTFTLLLSAICHDVDHTGRSNDFEIKSKSGLALTYQD